MISDAEFASLVHHFPGLRAMEDEHRRSFCASAVAVRARDGEALFEPGQACEQFLLLTSGAVKVSARSETAREILLYRVEPGQLCVLTLSCALGHDPYPARGVLTEDAHAIALPVARFEDLVTRSLPLRRMVFGSLSGRMNDLMALVEEVTFRHLDQRVARWLLQATGDASPAVEGVTHQQIADELGSVRELVSRVLASFADQGWVALGRKRIEVLDRGGLGGLGGG